MKGGSSQKSMFSTHWLVWSSGLLGLCISGKLGTLKNVDLTKLMKPILLNKYLTKFLFWPQIAQRSSRHKSEFTSINIEAPSTGTFQAPLFLLLFIKTPIDGPFP